MFSRRTPRKDGGANGVNSGNGFVGRQVWLHDLVEAITTALIAATRPIQEQHLGTVQETFTAAKTESQAGDQIVRELVPGSSQYVTSSSSQGTSSSPAEPVGWVFDNQHKLFRPETLLMELPGNGGAMGDEGTALRDLSAVNRQSATKTTVEVPTAALMQNNALVIDEATIELECVFDRFAAEADPRRSCAPRLGVWLDKTGMGSPARIVIKFKRVDRPEGASRIEDALLRNIQ
jgi:hypothetical protein